MSREKALEILKKGTVIPATPLALTDDGVFDEQGQRLLTRYYLESGVGGIATAVHTTQFEIRDKGIDLFETVLKTVSGEIARFEKETGKTVVKVSGVCGKTEQAVREAETAKELGFDAVLLSPGGLNDMSEEYLVERTKAVAKVMPVIAFYLQTAVGGRRFSYGYWEKVCEVHGVVAVKCASFDRYSTIDVVRAASLSSRSDEITLYTGNDDNIIVDLTTEYKFNVEGREITRRFMGGLLGHWSAWAHRVCEIFSEIKNGEVSAKTLTLAAQITDANGALFDVANGFAGCIVGIHEILYRQGLMKSTRCLNPDEKLSPGQAEEIDRVCAMYPHLCDDEFVKENIESWKAKIK